MCRFFVPLVLIIAALFSCSSSRKIQNETEAVVSENILVKAFEPVPSIINVPLKIRTKVVEDMLNQQLNDTLYKADSMELGNFKPVKVRVRKAESISISLDGDELTYRVPLRIWMQFQFTVGALGLSHTEYQEMEAGIALKFKSRLTIQNDWKVSTVTQSDGYEWISNPVVKVRFLSIPVKPIADILLSKQKDTFGGIIDKAIVDLLDIKNLIQPLWTKIQKPIKLSSDPQLWLRLQPLNVNLTQLNGLEGLIYSSFGIKSVAETFFGDEPQCDTTKPLPEFVVPAKSDDGFIINLYSEITYENAGAMTKSYLLGKNFTAGKREIVILDVNIYGQDGYAVVSLDLTGAFRGKIYVIGRVEFDSSSSTISIEDIDFDLSTKSKLHNTADWLLHDIVISKVKPFLRFPIKEKILESQLMIQKMLCNQEISKNIFVNGTIDTLSIGGVRLTDTAIQAVLLAKGNLSLEIRE